ncbi:MAG: 50S ribosomal protein L17 [Candidatus Kerfeldbacteria bacterium]|nr:50S ribosomal protein L17 [Candidatus Kerfeldbacteria bacterium]
MRHRHKRKVLSRTRAARRSLIRGLAISLIVHGRIATTQAKAKTLRPFVERLITRGRNPSLANRRHLLSTLGHEVAVKKVLTTLGPRYAQRPGGYTRIVRLGQRAGDASPLALIEFVS